MFDKATHSNELLNELMSYPLNIKESLTFDRIRELVREYDNNFYVSFSGGKDSEVAVDFVAKSLKRLGFDKMNVMFVNTGLEYIEIQKFVRPFVDYVSEKYNIEINLDVEVPETNFIQTLTLYGYPVVSKEVSQVVYEARKGLANGDGTYERAIRQMKGERLNADGIKSPYNYEKYAFLLNVDFRVSNACCKKTKKAPAISYEKKTGLIRLLATSAEESRLRRSDWLKFGCNAFDCDRPKSQPFSFWTTNDFLEYIYINNLPIAKPYGKVVKKVSGLDNQLSFFDVFAGSDNTFGGTYTTTSQKRTGCTYCLYGAQHDNDRILRLQEMEPERSKFILRGGQYDDEGMWIPSKEGLGFAHVIDVLNEHGLDIRYDKTKLLEKAAA